MTRHFILLILLAAINRIDTTAQVWNRTGDIHSERGFFGKIQLLNNNTGWAANGRYIAQTIMPSIFLTGTRGSFCEKEISSV